MFVQRILTITRSFRVVVKQVKKRKIERWPWRRKGLGVVVVGRVDRVGSQREAWDVGATSSRPAGRADEFGMKGQRSRDD